MSESTDDEPEAVTRTRRWQLVATFDAPDTPDPVYDVQACEAMADALYASCQVALEHALPRALNLNVVDVSTVDD